MADAPTYSFHITLPGQDLPLRSGALVCITTSATRATVHGEVDKDGDIWLAMDLPPDENVNSQYFKKADLIELSQALLRLANLMED